jgi:RNA polymerase sigma-70 factor (ECF subfamily)
MKPDATPDESELIRRFRDGDEEAFRVLFDRCRKDLEARVERRLAKALKRRLSVSDFIQEARITAFTRRAELEDRGPGSFRNWLLGIVDMELHRGIRRHAGTAKRALDREVSRTFRLETSQYPGNAASPSQVAIGSEIEDLVKRAMAALPEDYMQVLHLTRVEHLELKEVARRMNRSTEAARKLYGRALLAFSKTMQKLGGGDYAR